MGSFHPIGIARHHPREWSNFQRFQGALGLSLGFGRLGSALPSEIDAGDGDAIEIAGIGAAVVPEV